MREAPLHLACWVIGARENPLLVTEGDGGERTESTTHYRNIPVLGGGVKDCRVLIIEHNGLLFGISWTLRTGEFSSSTTIGVVGSLNAPCMTHAGNLEYAWRHQCLMDPNLLCIRGCRQTDRCFLRIR